MLLLLLLPFWAVANSISTCCRCGVPKLAKKYTWKRSTMYLLQATGNSTAQLHRNSWETDNFKSISSNFSWVSFTIYCTTICISLPIHVPAAVAHSYMCVCVCMRQLSVCFSITLASVANEIYARRVKIVKVAASPAKGQNITQRQQQTHTHTHMYRHVCLGVFK